MQTFTLKSGTNNIGRNFRWIRIEGQRLLDAGLTRGTKLSCWEQGDGSIVLTTSAPHATYNSRLHTVAGTGTRPILDLCGKWVTGFIGDHTHFEVTVNPHAEGVDHNGELQVDQITLIIRPVNC